MTRPLHLRWIDPASEAARASEAAPDGPAEPSPPPSPEVVDAIRAVAVAAGLLADCWDVLDEDQRRALAGVVHERSEHLRRLATEEG